MTLLNCPRLNVTYVVKNRPLKQFNWFNLGFHIWNFIQWRLYITSLYIIQGNFIYKILDFIKGRIIWMGHLNKWKCIKSEIKITGFKPKNEVIELILNFFSWNSWFWWLFTRIENESSPGETDDVFILGKKQDLKQCVREISALRVKRVEFAAKSRREFSLPARLIAVFKIHEATDVCNEAQSGATARLIAGAQNHSGWVWRGFWSQKMGGGDKGKGDVVLRGGKRRMKNRVKRTRRGHGESGLHNARSSPSRAPFSRSVWGMHKGVGGRGGEGSC